jgi:hypothetical protein
MRIGPTVGLRLDASIELAAGDRPETSHVRFWKLDIGRGGSGATSESPVTRRRDSTIWLSREALLESRTFVLVHSASSGGDVAQLFAATGTSSHHLCGGRGAQGRNHRWNGRVITKSRHTNTKSDEPKSLCTLNAPCGHRKQVQLSARDLSRCRPRSCPGDERDGILVPPTG